MFYTSVGNVKSFIPITSLEKKRLEVDSGKPRVRSSPTSSTTLKPLPLQSKPLLPAPSFSLNLRLSDRDFNTLESVAGSDFEERFLFEEWALSETFPKDIKPSQLYRYFVYVLGHQQNHPSLLSIATKLKEMGLDGSLDPRKVNALATTVFANHAPLMPLGTKLTEGIGTPHLDELASPLIEGIFSFLSNNNIFSLNTRMRRLLSIPSMAKIVSRNFLARTNPAIVRWIESLKLPTTNWEAINRLVQQRDFLSPTRVYDHNWANDLCPLSDGRVVLMCGGKLQILNPNTGTIVNVCSDLIHKIRVPQGKKLSCIEMMEIPGKRLAINFAFNDHASAESRLLIYDVENDKVLSVVEIGEMINSFTLAGDHRLVLGLASGIQIRDSQTGQLQRTISDSQEQEFYQVVGLSNGLIVTGSTDKRIKIRVWDSETGMLKRTLIDEPVSESFGNLNLQVTPDGNLSANISGSVNVAKFWLLWNPETGERIKSGNRPFSAMPYNLFVLRHNPKLNIARTTTGESIIDLRLNSRNNYVEKFKILRDGRIITTFQHGSGFSLQYDQIPNLIAAATSPIPPSDLLPAIPQSKTAPSSALLERAVVANPVRHLESQREKIRRWVVLAVLVSAIAWAWLSYRPQTVF